MSRYILTCILVFSVLLTSCMEGVAGPAASSATNGSGNSTSTTPSAKSLEGQDPSEWSCKTFTGNDQNRKSFRDDWGTGRGYARWMFEAGCARDWPSDWTAKKAATAPTVKPTSAPKAGAPAAAQQQAVEQNQIEFGKWLLQLGANNSQTVADIGYAAVIGRGSMICRNPRPGPTYSDEFGLPIETTLCGAKTPDKNTVMLDITLVGMAIFGTPGFPVDDVVAVAKVGNDVLLLVAAAASTWLVARGAVVLATQGRHTDPSHNPNLKGTQARTMIAIILSVWPAAAAGNGGPDRRCGAVRDAGGTVIRLAIWMADSTRATGGVLTAVDPTNPRPYVSGYESSLENFMKGPSAKRLEQAKHWWDNMFPCPGSLPPLQPAQ